ncbi:MAG: Na+/H+ antiporter NhaA [Croceibacter sp.]|uniref:Na+/H+ antiporter NhaA n=1 Tax=Croceibacter sp. TaxID=2024829 RepID=UPI000C487288|nr:Na+/H+ antiporter NhaA [Croceibacter sp.]MBG27078.1 Na+/H+ antiporter NhaA [Croceibacter sp.]
MRIAKNPVETFINSSTSGSYILLLFTVIALVWANSPWHESYHTFWNETFAIGFSNTDFIIEKPLYLWVNDGLMTIFFFYVGLEIKREILDGELTTMRKASMPIFAALGGIVVPIAIFLLLHDQDRGASGWGIPMATDIAFSLGILNLLGKRVPLGLKIFLTTFAIIDDIGAILVIATFYSHEMHLSYLFVALGILTFLAFLAYKKFHSKYLLLISGIAVWVLFLKSGIHPTIAGVLLALVIPSSRNIELDNFFEEIRKSLNLFKKTKAKRIVLSDEQQDAVDKINLITDRVQTPMQQLENGLSGWVAIVIMPIFALANAGITISLDSLSTTELISQIAIAMVLGKVIGITLFSYLAYKLKIAVLPTGINFKQILGVSFLGGVGFTMSLFIAELAFRSNDLLTTSKIGILLGSMVAGIAGYLILRFQLKKNEEEKASRNV